MADLQYFLIKSKDSVPAMYYDKDGVLVGHVKRAHWFDVISDIDQMKNYLRHYDIDKTEVVIIEMLISLDEMPMFL
jgi:hypothetical protein